MTFNKRIALAALVALAIVPQQAGGADWPSKQVMIYVTTGAGGSTDTMARIAAENLSKKFGHAFVVDNRPSAGGVLATTQVVDAAPDGHTLLFTASSAVFLAPLMQKMNFTPEKRLIPVTNVGTGSQIVAVKRSLPVNNLSEFLSYAKSNPNKLNFAIAGFNNITHLAPVLLFKRAGVSLVMVPSRTETQAVTDLIAGSVDFYYGNASSLLRLRDNPAIRLLAVSTGQRLPTAPDLPTVSETLPGFVFASWNGFFVPTGTPTDVVEGLRSAVISMVKAPEISARLIGLGILPGGQTKAEVEAVIENDRQNFADAAKAAGSPAP